MKNLKLKEVSEMVFRYSQDKHIDLLSAYKKVDDIIENVNCFTYEQVKTYLFNNDVPLTYKQK